MKQSILGMLSMITFLGALFGAQTTFANTDNDNLVWEECSTKLVGDSFWTPKTAAYCTTITVPENRNNPASREITLPVKRIPATSDNPAEPIFHLTGGPGMSNMGFRPTAEMLENHDVILVGYRGIDGSVYLDCPEVAEASKGVDNDLLGEASLANMQAAIGNCSQRLRDEGVDLDGYSVLEVADDLEAAREALGYDRIHLLSQSYGTRIAQLYALRYPKRVTRSAMIGVNPPGRFVWEPEVIDAQLIHYATLGQEASLPDLAETIRQVNADMPEKWLFFSINPGKTKSVAFAMLFNRNSAALVFDAYLAAANGDPSGLALMSIAYDFIIPGMVVWGEFLAKAFSADFDPNRDYAELHAPDSIMGAPIAELIWPTASDWNMERIPAEYRTVQPSAVDTLLISGNVDFSTPAEHATNDLLPALENGQQIILTDMGHTADYWTQQPEAATKLLQGYFDEGVVDRTLFEPMPMDFNTGFFTFPRLAKLLIFSPLVLLVILVWGGRALSKRWAQRRAAS
ncbi:MAG: alpha/beta fold hydrolase [Ardenticatenaceae bacterium]|nr:alpha/beta fold hydrolase [Ardenticatenaceae bacterium]